MGKKKTTESQNLGRVEQNVKAVTSEYVTVAYNSPRGINFQVGAKNIAINGNNIGLISKEKGILPVGLYGYTRILSEDWEAIVTTYGSMDIFKNNLIFAESSKERSEDRAEEQSELRHGLEPITTVTGRTEEANVTV